MPTRPHSRTGPERRPAGALLLLASLVPVLLWASCSSRCGGSGSERAPADAGSAHVAEMPADLATPLPPVEPLALGKPALAGFAYNRGAGREAFTRALAAEAAGQWQDAAVAAEEVLAVNPGHLEASWVLALVRGRMGAFPDVLAPLSGAVAGDFLRWGERSLEEPAFAGFLASAHGPRYRELIEVYGEEFRRIATTQLLVVGRRGRAWYPERPGAHRINHRSEVYAYDPDSGQYVRVSRTDGSLVGYVRAPGGGSLLYASYRQVHVPDEGAAYLPEVRVGVVDLDRGEMLREIVFADVVTIELTHHLPATTDGAAPAAPEPVARVQSRDGAWRRHALDVDAGEARELADAGVPAGLDVPALPGAEGPAADTLVVSFDSVRRQRLPVDHVLADWDQAGTAGAFRLEHTRKTVTLAAGESADGHSMIWSPTRARLALATAGDACAAEPEARRVTLYVVDATTGALHPVATGEGDFAPVWLDDTRLAYMQGRGRDSAVHIVDVVTGARIARLDGPGGVGTTHLPWQRCPPPPAVDAGAPAADAGLTDAAPGRP